MEIVEFHRVLTVVHGGEVFALGHVFALPLLFKLIGNLTILTKSWKGMKNGKEIHFPNREFELLKYMALNPNIVFSKEHLFEKIWGYDYMSDNATVTVHINRIREKIEDDPKNPQIIETVWGAGYRLNLR